MTLTPQQAARAPRKLSSAAEVRAFIDELRRTMADLTAILAEETRLVAAADLRAAAPLERRKSELSHRYMADLTVLRANAALVRQVAAPALDLLKRDNAALQPVLELNLATLATAHAVAEGIIRAVSSTVQARRAPATYGANGRTAAPPPLASAPMAISRSL